MFESFAEDIAARARRSGAGPLAALIISQGYDSVRPLFENTPRALYWIVDALTIAGTAAGAVAVLSVLVRHWRELTVRAWGWLLLVTLLTLFDLGTFLALSAPWL